MNSEGLVRLINQWNSFSDLKSDGSLQEFAAWLLAKESETKAAGNDEDDVKFKIIELSRVVEIRAKELFEGSSTELQLVRILTIIQKMKSPCKKDVVEASLLESSTGFNMIKTLVRKKLVKEISDSRDKRSLLVTITPQGSAYLASQAKNFEKILLLKAMKSDTEKRAFIKMINTLCAFHRTDLIKTAPVNHKK